MHTTITPDGASVNVSISNAGDKAYVTFTGSQGEWLGIGWAGNTFPCCGSVDLLDPSSNVVASTGLVPAHPSSDWEVDGLSVSGTYTILIDPAGGTGSLTLTLSDPLAESLSVNGASTTVSIARVAQDAEVTFSGTAGEHLGLGLTNDTFCCSGGFTLFDPTGKSVGSNGFGVNVSDWQLPTLAATGTYTLFFDPGPNTGSVTMTLSDALTGSLVVNGSSATVSIARAGQAEWLTFSGSAGERIGVGFTSDTFSGVGKATLSDAGSNEIASDGWGPGAPDWELPQLSATGTFTLVIDTGNNTGSVVVTMSDDLTGSLVVDGPPLTVSIQRPGQDERLAFSGTAGDLLQVNFSGYAFSAGCCVQVTIYDPSGNYVDSARFVGANTTTWAPSSQLNSTGTYTLVADPSTNTGSVTIALAHQGAYEPLPQTYGPCDGGLDALNQSGCWRSVNTLLGAFTTQATDATLRTQLGIPFAMVRSYTSANTNSGHFGPGWTDSYGASLLFQQNGDVLVQDENGQQVYFTKQPDGSFKPPNGGIASLTAVAGGYQLLNDDQTLLSFDSQGRLLSIKDRNGEGVTLAYGAGGNLSSATDAAGRVVTFGSNSDGTLASMTLPDGRQVSYGYTNGRLTSVTDMAGGVTSYGYDAAGRLSSITDPDGHAIVQNSYGSDGRIATQTDALSHQSNFAWNTSTQTETVTDANNHAWTAAYQNNMLVKTTDPLGHATSYSYDANDNLASVKDPLGHTTSYTWDANHNMLTRTAPSPLSYVETWTYDSKNDVLSYKDGRGNATSYGYDSVGNLTSQTQPGNVTTGYGRDPAGTGLLVSQTDPRGKTTTYAYSSDGNLASSTSPLGEKTTMHYDSAGRLTSQTDPRGNVSGANPADYTTSYSYNKNDEQTSLTDPLGHVTSRSYDPDGNLSSLTDPNNHTTSYAYNADDQLITVTAPGTTTTTYSYDPVGNLTGRTDANNHTTSYGYDGANELTSTTDPLNRAWSYTYDADGNKKTATTPSGGVTTYGYDALNRLTSIGYSDSTPAVSFSYDANGNRTGMTDSAGTLSYSYNPLNQLTGASRGNASFTYSYDPAGNITQRVYPDGTTTTYSYDDDERLTSATFNGNTTSYSYDPASELTQTVRPAGNGWTETRSYDHAGQLTQIKDANGSSILQQLTYAYDPAGKATSLTRQNGAEYYQYDSRDRLTKVCYDNPCSSATDTISWTYDPVGNRLTETRPSGSTTYSYDAADELTQATGPSGTTTYSYDSSGDQTTAGTSTYTYNLAKQITSAAVNGATTSYSYDGDGNRLSATSNSTTTNYLWDINNALPELATETDGSGATLRDYIQGFDTIALIEGGATYYYHHDRLGSVTALSSSSGAAEWTYTYEPFGDPKATTKVDPNAPTNPLQYVDQYLGPNTGLYDLRARQYDPATGIFTSPDPTPAGPNKPYEPPYDYAGQDPINNYDLSGESIDWGRIVAGILGIASPDKHPQEPIRGREPKTDPPAIEQPHDGPPSGEGGPPGVVLPTFPPGEKEPGEKEPEGGHEPEGETETEPAPEKNDFRIANLPWATPVFSPTIHVPQSTQPGILGFHHGRWP